MKIDQNQILYFHNCINVLQVCVQHKLENKIEHASCKLDQFTDVLIPWY